LQRGESARQSLLERNYPPSVDLIALDLADLESINQAAKTLKSQYGRIDLLINNAGVMATPHTLSKQGLELQFAVNHLGHMALSLALLPLLSSQPGARVVTVTSGVQYMGRIAWDDLQGEQRYDRWAAYAQSKLANVMFALELDKRAQKARIDVASLLAHPGLARTNLQPASVAANQSWQEAFAYRLMDPMFQSAAMGSRPQLHAATSPTAHGGEQYGPRFNFRGYPKRCRIAASALKDAERQRLWSVSEQLLRDRGAALTAIIDD
jgi:protochlorophyllide reductase